MKYTFNKKLFYKAFPRPSELFLDNFYKKIFFKKKTTSTYSKKYSKIEIFNKAKDAELIIWLLKKYVNNKKKINFLEIGSGEGFLLKSAKNNKFNVLGVDYQKQPILKFNKIIYPYFVEENPKIFLNKILKDKKLYDIIALQNVLEHVLKPEKLIKNILKKLKKNGLLFIQVPNDFSLLQHTIKKYKLVNNNYWFSPPIHLNYFNNKNISSFFSKFKLKTLDFFSDFPIELYLFLGKNNYVNNKNLGKNVHLARIRINKFILDQGFEKAYKFYKSCHDLGIGRLMRLILKK
jgi:SAM-dependent methyltransferase